MHSTRGTTCAMVLRQIFYRFTGSAPQTLCSASSARNFWRKKFSREQIFVSWRLIAKIAKISTSRKFPAIRYQEIVHKRELDSLIGQLQHARAVVKAGKSFLRRMIELSEIAHKPCHYIRLNRSFHSDLMWWRLFLHSWNGISMMSTLMPTCPDLSIISDASGTWDCAAVWDTQWFQLQWGTGPFANSQIASKELLPIITACGVWEKGWKGRHVLCYCDNESQELVKTRISCKCSTVYFSLRQA